MTIREGDRIALLGSRIAVLDAAVSSTSATNIVCADVSGLASGDRIAIDNEIMDVGTITVATKTAAVTRGVFSLAATHADESPVTEITSLFYVETATYRAGFLAPLRTPNQFVLLPRKTVISGAEAVDGYSAGERMRGLYQDGGGTAVVLDREDMAVHARLGLVILLRPEGGHWELGVRRI